MGTPVTLRVIFVKKKQGTLSKDDLLLQSIVFITWFMVY